MSDTTVSDRTVHVLHPAWKLAKTPIPAPLAERMGLSPGEFQRLRDCVMARARVGARSPQHKTRAELVLRCFFEHKPLWVQEWSCDSLGVEGRKEARRNNLRFRGARWANSAFPGNVLSNGYAAFLQDTTPGETDPKAASLNAAYAIGDFCELYREWAGVEADITPRLEHLERVRSTSRLAKARMRAEWNVKRGVNL
jgi:hypothetical protein